MSSDENDPFLPSVPADRQRPQTNRAVLGALLLLLAAAIVFSLWSLVFKDDDSSAGTDTGGAAAGPTPVTIPTSTPSPLVGGVGAPTPDVGVAGADGELPTSAPIATVVPTAVPDGFEACGADRAPIATRTYIVDTTTTPLNQRSEPAVAGELVGTFDPGATGLVFTGDCVVNLADGYVWWEINNGTADVWVASDFVSPN